MEFNRTEVYNVHEHNQFEQSEEQLNGRISQLAEINKPWQCEERRAKIQAEMGIIAFELSERFRENKSVEIEEAWANHG